MFHRHRRWRCATRVALVLAVALIFTSLPAAAGDPQSPTVPAAKTGIKASVDRVVKAVAPTMKATPAARQQTATGGTDRGTWAFFRSPIGIAVVGTLAAGVGYALYSTSHDRIHSPGKQ